MSATPHDPHPAPAPAAAGPTLAPVALRTAHPGPPLDSSALLQGGKAITIHHKGEFYRLQTTRQGKLILTK